jgi:hypothetical protein
VRHLTVSTNRISCIKLKNRNFTYSSIYLSSFHRFFYRVPFLLQDFTHFHYSMLFQSLLFSFPTNYVFLASFPTYSVLSQTFPSLFPLNFPHVAFLLLHCFHHYSPPLFYFRGISSICSSLFLLPFCTFLPFPPPPTFMYLTCLSPRLLPPSVFPFSLLYVPPHTIVIFLRGPKTTTGECILLHEIENLKMNKRYLTSRPKSQGRVVLESSTGR